MRQIIRFEVHIGTGSTQKGFVVFGDYDLGQVLVTEDLAVTECPQAPNVRLAAYKASLWKQLSRHPLLPVLEAIPLDDLDGCVVEIESLDSIAAVVKRGDETIYEVD